MNACAKGATTINDTFTPDETQASTSKRRRWVTPTVGATALVIGLAVGAVVAAAGVDVEDTVEYQALADEVGTLESALSGQEKRAEAAETALAEAEASLSKREAAVAEAEAALAQREAAVARTEEEPAAEATAAGSAAEPESTLAQANALRSAESYLEFTGFSRQGLIDQLSSEYGDGYAVEDATWAVDQLTVDWNEQAVRSAESYLEFTGFSRQGLIEQLSSEYGDKYTVAQAIYAVDQLGL